MPPLTRLLAGAVLLTAAVPTAADDLSGADSLICAARVVVVCTETGDCEEGLPSELNVPQFIEMDLTGKRLRTTKASGEDRSTPIGSLTRQGGEIVAQGVEAGRAFSFVISETTGRATVAVARDGLGVTVFGSCTPLPAPR